MEVVCPKVVRAVKNVVKDRLSDESIANIQKVTFLANDDETKKEIVWFKKHVPEFVLYDRNNPRHLRKKFGNRLYPFEIRMS